MGRMVKCCVTENKNEIYDYQAEIRKQLDILEKDQLQK